MVLAIAGCGSNGSGGSANSTDEACAFDGSGGSLRLQSGSSHAHVWKDLTVDLAAGQLSGRVSSLDEGQQSIAEIDETVAASALSSLQGRLRTICGTLSSAEAPPDDFGGGTTTLTVESRSHGSFALVGTGLNSSVAAGNRVLEASREDYLQIVAAFPEPGR
ncbi:MAG: hypothetical protein DRJ42_22020 [Deltaproteobacteria bacterium]|nr:MAG: hypothetical protein DRJ42_22020 [Deltaproteobacteria bacterium]